MLDIALTGGFLVALATICTVDPKTLLTWVWGFALVSLVGRILYLLTL
jgi:hypothetical protein